VGVIVLGILALAGIGGAVPAGAATAGQAGSVHVVLDLVALLVAGAAILITGNGMNNAVLSMACSAHRGGHSPPADPVGCTRSYLKIV
jgi:hypothetical protein